MVSEDRKAEGLALTLSIADNVTMPKLTGMGRLGLVTPSAQDRAAQRWIEDVGIKCASPRQRVDGLSGGNQQKVAVARLLYADVDILLLDEPTRGIDVGSKVEIYRLIDSAARGDLAAGRAPKGVIMVSSYLPELLGVCDRVAVMHRGRLGPARPVAEVNEHGVMLEATGGQGAGRVPNNGAEFAENGVSP
jgi:ribose transport system ATP-binding protein